MKYFTVNKVTVASIGKFTLKISNAKVYGK